MGWDKPAEVQGGRETARDAATVEVAELGLLPLTHLHAARATGVEATARGRRHRARHITGEHLHATASFWIGRRYAARQGVSVRVARAAEDEARRSHRG